MKLKRPNWKRRAEILADALMWQISRGMTMHDEDNDPCVGCRADDVLTVMGRFEDLSPATRRAAAKRLASMRGNTNREEQGR